MVTTSGAVLERRHGSASASVMLLAGALMLTTTTSGVPLLTHTATTTAGPSRTFNQGHGGMSVEKFSSTGAQATYKSTANAGVSTSASQISELRERSGLTIDQLGRLFGVSRRSVHNWINGKSMAPQHEERASLVLGIINTLPGTTPQERRAHLLASREGKSIFHALLAQLHENATLQVSALNPRELIQL